MKLLKSTIAVLAMASSSLFALSGHAEEGHRNCRANPGGEWPIDPPAYVVRNCAFCHGPSLQGLAVAPRLAGQHQDYIIYQLERFRDKERNNPFSLKYMSHVAVSVLPDSYCELGAYISTMPAEARNDGDEALAPKGEEIFRHGAPDDNIPACQFCHGPEAQGVGRFPRLGGQSYYYLKRRLEQWVEGYGRISSHMPGIASKLNPEQIDAIASYLSFLPAAPSPGEY
jgi:cytochrome c553